MRIATRRALPAALLTLAVAPAGAAALPTVSADRACYAAGAELMTFTGGGFTPGAAIELFLVANGRLASVSARADTAGAFVHEVPAPSFDDVGARPPRFTLDLTANDQEKFGAYGPIGPPEESFAATDVTISDWDADVAAWNTRGAATSRRGAPETVKAYGWTSAGTSLYLHYLKGSRRVHTQKVGPLGGPCGGLTRRIKVFTFNGAKAGTYGIRCSATPTWRPKKARWTGYRAVRLR